MNLIDLYVEPADPAPPTEKELDEVIEWYEKEKKDAARRFSRFDSTDEEAIS
jgi:hypothetical protein